MSRHRTIIDLDARVVHTRIGTTVAIDRLEHTPDALFFARPLPGNARIIYQRCWVLPAHGWVISRFTFAPGVVPDSDWYIDVDQTRLEPTEWTIHDRYLDLFIHEGRAYDVLDAAEFADALAAGEIGQPEALAALRDLDAVCKALRRHGYSCAALLAEYAPGLPA